MHALSVLMCLSHKEMQVLCLFNNNANKPKKRRSRNATYLHTWQLLFGDVQKTCSSPTWWSLSIVQLNECWGWVNDRLSSVFLAGEDTWKHLQILDAARQPFLSLNMRSKGKHCCDLKDQKWQCPKHTCISIKLFMYDYHNCICSISQCYQCNQTFVKEPSGYFLEFFPLCCLNNSRTPKPYGPIFLKAV